MWILDRERLPPPLVRMNVIAVGATLAGMGAVGAWSGDGVAVVITWLIGHVAWGSYLAWKLPDRDPRE
jgi:hypothetical protein